MMTRKFLPSAEKVAEKFHFCHILTPETTAIGQELQVIQVLRNWCDGPSNINSYCKRQCNFRLSVDHKQCQGSSRLISTAIRRSTTRYQHASFVDGIVSRGSSSESPPSFIICRHCFSLNGYVISSDRQNELHG